MLTDCLNLCWLVQQTRWQNSSAQEWKTLHWYCAHMHTTACTDTNVQVNTHTATHHIFSCVACKSEMRPVYQSDGFNAYKYSERSKCSEYWQKRQDAVSGDRGGEEGEEEEYLCRYLVYLTPSPPARECDWILRFWLITTRGWCSVWFKLPEDVALCSWCLQRHRGNVWNLKLNS